MTLPSFLVPAVDSWAALYGDHRAVSVTVRFLHLAAIVVGGGTALAADRRTLRSIGSGELREAAIAELGAAHRVVVPALALVVATGALMALSDRATFFASTAYWTKMGLVVLLLANGGLLLAGERAYVAGRPTGAGLLRAASGLSLLLWLAVLFAGVWLTAAA
jgi:hypothetical protein